MADSSKRSNPQRPPRQRWCLRRFAMACFGAAALSAAFALYQHAARPPAPQLSAPAVAQAPFDLSSPDDFAWAWPEQLGSAASMFACWPGAASNAKHSVVVWTDALNRVVAYGSARGETALAPYALPLGAGSSAAAVAQQPINAAAHGFVIRARVHGHTLQINDTTLSCSRTWDD